MVNEERQQRINQLKALRAELMALKEAQDEGDGDNEALKTLRREYSAEIEDGTQDKGNIDSVKQEIYEQYTDESEQIEENDYQKTMGRRR